MDLIHDAVLRGHGTRPSFVNAGIMKTAVVEDDNRREPGGNVAGAVGGELKHACGAQLVRLASLRRRNRRKQRQQQAGSDGPGTV